MKPALRREIARRRAMLRDKETTELLQRVARVLATLRNLLRGNAQGGAYLAQSMYVAVHKHLKCRSTE